MRRAASLPAALAALTELGSTRTCHAIQNRWTKLKRTHHRRLWTPEEDGILRRAANRAEAHARLEELGYSRTLDSVQRRRKRLGCVGRLESGERWRERRERVSRWIEANSPMTQAEYEQGIRELEGDR